ncbi:MAG TPA: phosphoribosylanthranilate isomerase [Thermoanaerobaculia bacterium]|nr:phosphoribosylanthranilate isomerase [Thermoanaerobaculia bacterium]
MTGVKICGVTRPADALLAIELGASYLGLNFYPRSPRCVALGQAREIAAAAAGKVPLVGVFVDRPPAEVEEVAAEVGLDLLQFSGDEGPAEVGPFAARAIKAFRTGGDPGPEALAPYSRAWALLFDVRHGSLYGGTGVSWPYGSVAAICAARRVFLAGGVNPGNVRRAMEESGAHALDVCSSVESSPGIKDRELLERLFAEVRNGQGTPPS